MSLLLENIWDNFTNEIKPKDGKNIIEFVSAGPKNYAYKLDSGKTNALVKGFALNHIQHKVLILNQLEKL